MRRSWIKRYSSAVRYKNMSNHPFTFIDIIKILLENYRNDFLAKEFKHEAIELTDSSTGVESMEADKTKLIIKPCYTSFFKLGVNLFCTASQNSMVKVKLERFYSMKHGFSTDFLPSSQDI